MAAEHVCGWWGEAGWAGCAVAPAHGAAVGLAAACTGSSGCSEQSPPRSPHRVRPALPPFPRTTDVGSCREEVASCSERAYESLSVADAASVLMLGGEAEVEAYAREVRSAGRPGEVTDCWRVRWQELLVRNREQRGLSRRATLTPHVRLAPCSTAGRCLAGASPSTSAVTAPTAVPTEPRRQRWT